MDSAARITQKREQRNTTQFKNKIKLKKKKVQ